jgi:hypothetical protein
VHERLLRAEGNAERADMPFENLDQWGARPVGGKGRSIWNARFPTAAITANGGSYRRRWGS